MFRRLSTIAAIAVACFCSSQAAHAQFGGLSVQVGGYGSGVRVGGYSYGNGFYNSYGNGYRNGYGNPFYGTPYTSSFNGGYYNNGRPYTGLYPNFGYSYVAPPYYYAPVRPYPIRRFRYR
jgi:hypothetical protein